MGRKRYLHTLVPLDKGDTGGKDDPHHFCAGRHDSSQLNDGSITLPAAGRVLIFCPPLPSPIAQGRTDWIEKVQRNGVGPWNLPIRDRNGSVLPPAYSNVTHASFSVAGSRQLLDKEVLNRACLAPVVWLAQRETGRHLSVGTESRPIDVFRYWQLVS